MTNIYDYEKARTWFRDEYWYTACNLAKWVAQRPKYVESDTVVEAVLEEFEFDRKPDLPLDADSVYMWCYEELEILIKEALE
ncbi:MAG: hypothetical protein MK081_13430 [Flavobacteriales bacterium]|nr:hypothetical protein [Flavobacteriales bacterium]